MRTLVRAACAIGVMALVSLVAVVPVAAQGVTTSAMRGRVMDDQGSAVVGATLTLTLTSTGQRFTTASRAGGVYNFENVPVGGPYTLEARAIGMQPLTRTGIILALGQALELNLTVQRSAVQLTTIEVTATETDPVFSPSMTGAEFTVDDTTMRRLPTLDRSFTDFVRLTPQVAEPDAGGVSVAGQNNRFNTIQVDGSTVNDRFGLGSTGQTGGQANGRAVGIEAVQEYQVLLAPYDVRQGNFTGALINAVTKSGTNTLHGSAFWFFRNQSFAGDPLGLTDFRQHQFGASVGGPITRDRVHFFVNAEFRQRTAPARGPYLGQPATLGVPVASQADIDAFNAAMTGYGLPSGGVGSLVNNQNPLANLLARVDMQIGDRSRLTFRYIYNSANDDIFSRSSSGSSYQLSTNAYHFRNRTNNPSLQFFTNFASGASNELLLSWNRIRDRRAPDAQAPLIQVQNFAAADGSGNYTMIAGAERFSQGNELDQDIFEITDNFTFSVGEAHRITVGTRNELYKVRNLFAQSSYGVWTFDNLADFQNGVVERYEVGGDIAGNGIAATFNAGILGGYVQDQWQVSPTFALTLGLRVDAPTFFDQPVYDARVAADGFNTDVPSGQLMLSPRLGFNLDLGERRTQIRGGAGLFTGTPAYVWYSNAFSNNGTKLGQLSCTGGNAPAFTPTNFNVDSPVLTCQDGTGIAAGTTIGEVDIIGADTKFPQVLRGNLSVDHRFGTNLIASVEFLYTRGINDFFIVNRNLAPSVGTDANGRVMYGTVNGNGTVSPNYVDVTLYGPSFNGGVYELLNTNNNRSWSLTTQLMKRFSDNWQGMVAYTYSDARDVQSFTSSRAISNWRFGRTMVGADTDDNATTGSFNRPHRLVIAGTYTFPWRSVPTDISLSYVGQSGQPYTLLAGGSSGRGDLNADGTNTNDPIYLPNDATTEMQFQDILDGSGNVAHTAAAQATAFNQYITGESCLAEQRGRIMARNSCQNPWQSFLNLTIRQTLPRFGDNALTLEVGIFNVLNLLKSDWGQIKSVGGGVFYTDAPLTVRTTDGAGNLIYQFDPADVTDRFQITNATGNSYQVQVGLRYAF